ncbi:MAG TPA: hypothetical protein VNQ76_02330 [Planctomicrobium sp.]|nr:hypothetical protein [Planctomicrobium sp.]
MRFTQKALWWIWIALPVAFLVMQYGRLQGSLQKVRAAISLSTASGFLSQGKHDAAEEALQSSLTRLPAREFLVRNQIRLELAKLALKKGQLDKSYEWLQQIDTADSAGSEQIRSPNFRREVQRVLAQNNFYTAWMMRMEGQSRTDWEPILEASRQAFRHLAETSSLPEERDQFTRDNEAAIRLSQLDDRFLGALPLPDAAQRRETSGGETGKGRRHRSEQPGKQPGSVASQIEIDIDDVGT